MIFLNFALNEKLMSSTARTEIVKTCFILLSVLSDDGRLRQGIFTMSIFDLYTQANGKYSWGVTKVLYMRDIYWT